MEPDNDGFQSWNLLFQGLIFRFHVDLWGCNHHGVYMEVCLEDDDVPFHLDDFLGFQPLFFRCDFAFLDIINYQPKNQLISYPMC